MRQTGRCFFGEHSQCCGVGYPPQEGRHETCACGCHRKQTPRQLADWLVAADPRFAGHRDGRLVDAIEETINKALRESGERS